MTHKLATTSKGVARASQFSRTANTLRLAHLMEEQQRLEIAGRITELREKSRWTQPEIAEKLGLTLRGYQKIEEKGTTKFDRVAAIAAIHEVDPDWIWEGRERGPAPDPFATEAVVTGGEVRAKLDELLSGQAELLSTLSEVRDEQARLRRLQEPGSHDAEGTGS